MFLKAYICFYMQLEGQWVEGFFVVDVSFLCLQEGARYVLCYLIMVFYIYDFLIFAKGMLCWYGAVGSQIVAQTQKE